MEPDLDDKKGHEERTLYAKTLRIFFSIGFVYLVITFFADIFELLPNVVSVKKTTELLTLRASEYVAQSSVPVGWNWVYHLWHGDILSFSGVVFLAMISFFTYFVILFSYLKHKNRIYAALVFIQLLIFLAAAFGVSSGH